MKHAMVALTMCVAASAVSAQKPRARELGLSALIGGKTGTYDAITDVSGVQVGHTTLVSGEGPLVRGQGPVRTGVTVVHPRGKDSGDAVFGAWFTLNGNGEMTGTTWLQESGFLEGPVAITNTHSVGVVRDAILEWQVGKPGLQPWGLPVVAETYDGFLNDINGFHVKAAHAIAALDGAASGRVAEGNVGGGTGMVCHQFKGGIGTASRVLEPADGGYTVGVLVQCNYGLRPGLRVAGVPVGEEIPDLLPCYSLPGPAGSRPCGESGPTARKDEDSGSIIVVVATDAPLLPHQLKRVATRVALGVGRTGGYGGNSSGDIFVAFSTANGKAAAATAVHPVRMLPNDKINPIFQATVQATEEAILNALLAAETMTGRDGARVYALPHDRLLAAMKKYGRLGSRVPSIFVAGDSTAAATTTPDDQQGWAEPFAAYFDSAKLHVVNRAKGGRSSRTFITEGLWAELMGEVKAGDVVLIQFGHNDAGAPNEEPPGSTRPLRARGSLPGLGEETVEIDNVLTKKHETVYTFGHYIRQMIADTKAKGAVPVVLSLTVRNEWKDGKVERGSGRYGEWSKAIAEKAGVAFVDVTNLVADGFEALGADAVKAFYPHDHTHFEVKGADFQARAVVAGLKRLKPSPIAGGLSPAGDAIPAVRSN